MGLALRKEAKASNDCFLIKIAGGVHMDGSVRERMEEGRKRPWEYIQADLGDLSGSAPDHRSEANIAIQRVTGMSWFPGE